VLSLTELCTKLQVSAQTIEDLRSLRGTSWLPGGRELRFRIGEIEAWLTRLETEADRRHLSARGTLMARPRTAVGACGSIAVRRRGDRVIAETRIRDTDRRLRHVRGDRTDGSSGTASPQGAAPGSADVRQHQGPHAAEHFR